MLLFSMKGTGVNQAAIGLQVFKRIRLDDKKKAIDTNDPGNGDRMLSCSDGPCLTRVVTCIETKAPLVY